MTRRSLVLAVLAGAPCVAHAQCPAIPKLMSTSPDASGWFGNSVAMSHNVFADTPLLVVGEPNRDATAGEDNRGGFTVFAKDGAWDLSTLFANSTGENNERLGYSVSLDDPYLAASAPAYNSGQGRVRIFNRPFNASGYLLEDTITASPAGGNASFGTAVGISSFYGGWAVVGAPLHTVNGLTEAGGAFFFTRDGAGNWSQVLQLTGQDIDGAGTFEHRGIAVSMGQYAPYAVVGSPNGEDTGQPADHGTVSVFRRLSDGQIVVAHLMLRPPTPEAGEHFGASVALEGAVLAVGAPDEDVTFQENVLSQATDCGAVYVFELNANTWSFVAKLRSPNPTTNGWFGTKVATDGDRILVSEPGLHRVHIFKEVGGQWTHQATVMEPDNAAAGAFGSSLAIRDDDLAVGDWADDHSALINPGAVYTTAITGSLDTGDSCSNPRSAPLGQVSGCTSLATPTNLSSITTCGNGGNGQGNDVWFEFNPTCNGNAIFDTFGSDFDTVLSVHSACPTLFANNTIVCNDDASFAPPNERASLVTFNFTAGEHYLIRLTGYNEAHGSYVLRRSDYYPAHANDTCQTALNLGSAMGSWNFNNCGATVNFDLPAACIFGPLHVPFNDIWYRWTAPSTGVFNVNTCGSSLDTNLVIYQSTPVLPCPVPGSPYIACENSSFDSCVVGQESNAADITFDAAAGQTYLIRVGSAYNQGGPGVLTIGPGSQCNDIDFNNDGLFPDTTDIDTMLNMFSGAPCPTGSNPYCDSIDFNNDGLYPDTLDIDAFLSVFSGGPCLL